MFFLIPAADKGAQKELDRPQPILYCHLRGKIKGLQNGA
jgi:hypothetical protein